MFVCHTILAQNGLGRRGSIITNTKISFQSGQSLYYHFPSGTKNPHTNETFQTKNHGNTSYSGVSANKLIILKSVTLVHTNLK
jgi:hypothetical protein